MNKGSDCFPDWASPHSQEQRVNVFFPQHLHHYWLFLLFLMCASHTDIRWCIITLYLVFPWWFLNITFWLSLFFFELFSVHIFTPFFILIAVWEPHPEALKDYSWFCAHESFLKDMGNLMQCWRLNLGHLSAMQTLYPLCHHSSSNHHFWWGSYFCF